MTVTEKPPLRTVSHAPAARATQKVVDHLDRHWRHFIVRSPFCVLSSAGADGQADASQEGGRMTTTMESTRFQHRKTALVLKDRPGCQPVTSTPRPASFPHTTGRLRPPWGKPRMGG